MRVIEETTSAQIERILSSDTFQNAEALRRLLRFLADKSLCGEADQLKEYTIGVEAFGKPSSYDPRHDSIVRLQAGRLRLKLSEYYRTEGKDDLIIVEMPKGHFILSSTVRSSEPEAIPDPEGQSKLPLPGWPWRRAFQIACGALLAALVWGAYTSGQLRNERRKASLFTDGWTPELAELWHPFISTNRPLIVAIEDPLFVELKGTETYYRDKSLNRWEDVLSSPKVAAIRKAFKNVEIRPRYYYTDLGEANVAFLLGRLLSTRVQNMTLARSSLLYWQQLADNNVLLIGAPWFFDEHLGGMPIDPEMVQDRAGIHILHRQPGDPEILLDQLPTGVAEDGEVYALITHVPGPLGTTDVESITSDRTPGRVGAVQWLTDPALAQILYNRLKKPSGEIPRYYQLVLKVKFKDGVPTDTDYVMHRELRNGERAAATVHKNH